MGEVEARPDGFSVLLLPGQASSSAPHDPLHLSQALSFASSIEARPAATSPPILQEIAEPPEDHGARGPCRWLERGSPVAHWEPDLGVGLRKEGDNGASFKQVSNIKMFLRQ